MNRYAIALDWCDRMADCERARDEPLQLYDTRMRAKQTRERLRRPSHQPDRTPASGGLDAIRARSSTLLVAVQFGGQPARKVAVDAVRVGKRLDTVGGSRRGRMCA